MQNGRFVVEGVQNRTSRPQSAIMRHINHFALMRWIWMQIFGLEGEAVRAYGECPDKQEICATSTILP